MATDISRMADALCEMDDKVAELQYKLQRVQAVHDKSWACIVQGKLTVPVVLKDELTRALKDDTGGA